MKINFKKSIAKFSQLKKLHILVLIIPILSFQINSVRSFTTNDGLIDNRIIDINQDVYGQLWVITSSSISVFNGSHWKNFSTKFQHKDNPFNSYLLSYTKILIDENNNKYFLSDDGRIFLMDNNGLRELVSPLQSKGIFFNDIQLVSEESKQIIWATTANKGLAYFDNLWFSFGVDEGLNSNRILVAKSKGEYLFIITDRGLQFLKNRKVIYSFPTQDFSKYKNFSVAFDIRSRVNEKIPAIWILADNRLLKFENEKIYDHTIKYYNPYRENYTFIYSNGGNKLYLGNSYFIKVINIVNGDIQILNKEIGIPGSLKILFSDNEKNLWIGTDRGLTRLSFTAVSSFTDKEGLTESKIISSAKIGTDFYFGHSNGKLTILSNSKFYKLNFQSQINYYIEKLKERSFDITKIIAQKNKIILKVGNWGVFEVLSMNRLKPIFIVRDEREFINDLLFTSDHSLILVGNFIRNGDKINFYSVNTNLNLIEEDVIKSFSYKKIFQTRDESIWFVTEDAKILKLVRGRIEKIDLNGIIYSKINLIREDRGSNIFIGTDNGFVILMKNGEMKSYLNNGSENLNSRIEIYSFYFDDFNNVWLMTNKGLKFWNWKEFKFSSEWRNILPYRYNENAIEENERKIFISAENGLFVLHFDEEEIKDIQPRLYISEIIADGISYDPLNEIKLNELENLTFRYDAVLLSSNNNIEFSFKLDGYDSDWSAPTVAREVKYINLPEGNFKFLVRARTNYSDWTIPISTNLIKIKKPLYKKYEYILICVLFALVIFLFLHSTRKRNRIADNKFKNLQQQIQNVEKQNKQLRQEISKSLEISKSRMTFLAGLSHELRTPINSIIGFIDILLDSTLNLTEEEQKKYLSYISVNSRRLLILINDIIDLAKIDSGTISLEYSEVNLNAEVRETINLFREKIKQKQLDLILELDSELESKLLYVDRNRLQQIISNLLTNAIKFTEEGFIKVSTKFENDKFLLVVEDTGIGIPEGEVDFIFEEFRRSSNAIRKSIEGTGLGLSITKRLVEMMRGEIKVESQEELGTKFTVIFPQNKEYTNKIGKELRTNLN